MNVVGIDPSITGTGLAATGGSTRVIGRDGITKLPLDRRVQALKQLRAEIVAWTLGRCPTLVVIEHPAFGADHRCRPAGGDRAGSRHPGGDLHRPAPDETADAQARAASAHRPGSVGAAPGPAARRR